MAPFGALWGRRYRSLVGWFGSGEMTSIGSSLVLEAMKGVGSVREKLKMVRSHPRVPLRCWKVGS